MKDKVMTCRFCGKRIGIITWGIYRKVVVDAAAVMGEAGTMGKGRLAPEG